MSLGESLRELIVTASFITVGLALYLALKNLRVAIRGKRFHLFYVCARIGLGIVVALIAEAVSKQPFIPSSWRAWLYIVGLALVSVGYFGIALHYHARREDV